MRQPNSPATLNSLENRILESTPAEARHVLVVNAGDGRLARAIREKLGGKAAVSVVGIRPAMLLDVDDFSASNGDAWDLAWYAAQVSAHGPFDLIVFYQLHEFWRGELHALQRLLELAKPGALVWTSFQNAQASRMIARFLPPVQVGYLSLVDPLRTAPGIDLASLLDFVGRSGGTVAELWGMLDENAAEYCRKPPAKPVTWETRGVKVSIGTIADAFLWGAPMVAVGFWVRSETVAPSKPSISFSRYKAGLMQALLFPYPDVQTNEGVLGAARLEIAAWRRGPTAALGPLGRIVATQAGGTDQPKRVLLVGSGWGRDLLLLKREFPAWDWVGLERNGELRALGEDLLKEANLTAVTLSVDGAPALADQSFDLAISLGCFSLLYEPAALQLATELRRVTRGAIWHLEDGRGPEQAIHLKSYSLKAVYSQIGFESTAQPVLVDGSPNGMYLLKAAARA